MNCADLEVLLCDYMDGTLAEADRSALEEHLGHCHNCAELARDVKAAVGFMELAEEVEPPPALMTRILFELPAAHQARPRQPGAIRRLIHQWLQPVLQPRFAMGFAMTILSVSLLGKFAGISPRQITLEDLKPIRIWQKLDDNIYRGWQRTVKFYENLRVVYEIQTQLRDWTQKEQEIRGRTTEETPAAAPKSPSGTPSDAQPGQGNPPTEPRSRK